MQESFQVRDPIAASAGLPDLRVGEPRGPGADTLDPGRGFIGPLQGLLGDLSGLEGVGIEVETPSASLAHHADLRGLRVRAGIAHCKAEGFSLRVLLERCGDISGDKRAGVRVLIEDALGRCTLNLGGQPLDRDQAPLWRLLLRGQGLRGWPGAQGPARPKVKLSCAEGGDVQVADLSRRSQGLDDGLSLLDQAELCGLLSLEPARLRGLGCVGAVDPTLIPCVLSAVVDQLTPLQLIVGNAGAMLRLELVPYLTRLDSGWQTLVADQGRFRLDNAAVDSAWVYRPAGRGTRELRLYGADGRALAVIGTVPTAQGGEPSVWRTLINALTA